MNEDGDASSDGGHQFDVSNILADYFKDKIRQGIGVGDKRNSPSLSEGETRDSGDVVDGGVSDNNMNDERGDSPNANDSPDRKRSKKDKKAKKAKKKKKKKHKHHGHSHSLEVKTFSTKASEDNKEYSKESRVANETDSTMNEFRERERERERSRDRRPDRMDDAASSSRLHRRSRSRDRDGRASGRGERRRSRDRSQDRSRSRDHKSDRRRRDPNQDRRRERSRSSGRFRSPIRVRESSGRSARTGEGRINEETGLGAGFDKKELLEVARRNVKVMIQTGTLPKGVDVEKLGLDLTKEEASTTAESVDKFTEICRKIQETGDDDDAGTTTRVSHPFQVKERPIRMNIPNAVQLPAKTFQEKIKDTAALTAQFPVSSGSTHRKNEMELDWKPVKKNKEVTKDSKHLREATAKTTKKDTSTAFMPVASGISLDFSGNASRPILSVAPSPHREENLEETLKNMTIPQVMTKRVEALQKLQRDPADLEAKNLHEVTERVIREWSRSKQQPGQLTNSVDTSVKFLSPAELQEGPQAWVKKDQLQRTRAVEGGIGMALLQKMGWTPGTALGKNREGALEPLLPAIKMDRKGLVAQEEAIAKEFSVNVTIPNRSARASAQLQEVQATSLGGKHPVSALIELCTAQKYPAPEFIEMPAFGPDHKKTFLYKVTVNGKSYQPSERSPNKKLAKAAAALVALNEMGAVIGIEKAPRMSLLPHNTEVTSRAPASAEEPAHDMFQPLKCTDPSKMASNFLTSFHVGAGPALPNANAKQTPPQGLPSPQTVYEHHGLASPYPTGGASYSLWPNIDSSSSGQIQGVQGPIQGGATICSRGVGSSGPPRMTQTTQNQDVISTGGSTVRNAGGIASRSTLPAPYRAYFTGGQLCNFYADAYPTVGVNNVMEGRGQSGVERNTNNQRVPPTAMAVIAPSIATNPNITGLP